MAVHPYFLDTGYHLVGNDYCRWPVKELHDGVVMVMVMSIRPAIMPSTMRTCGVGVKAALRAGINEYS